MNSRSELDETVYIIPQKMSHKIYGNDGCYFMVRKDVYLEKEFGGTFKIILERKVGEPGGEKLKTCPKP